MLMLGRIFFLLLLAVFILTVIEYVLFRNMVVFYYKNGPFADKAIFEPMPEKSFIMKHLTEGENRGEFYIKQLSNGVLLHFKPKLKLWFTKGYFPTQRIVLAFIDGPSGSEVLCEVRPFYCAFLLPLFICFVFIFDVVLTNEYAGVSMKVFGVIVACFIGLALFLPFRPRSDTMSNVKNYLISSQNSQNSF